MSTDLARAADEPLIILDPRSATGIAANEKPRVKAIATISGGYREKLADGKSRPVRTQNGEIYVSGNAPGLEEFLNSRKRMSLTVAFPSNNPRDFIHQSFTQYTATALKCFGDETQITEIQNDTWVHHLAGTEDYARCLAGCKNSISIYFMLAKWEGRNPVMVFPDGFGLYRLRCTSLNSLRGILFAVQFMKQQTGFIAGIPFDLFLEKEEKVDPKGTKRQVWIWQARSRSPEGYELTAEALRGVLEASRSQINTMNLEAPRPPALQEAIADAREESRFSETGEDIPEGEVVDEKSAPTPMVPVETGQADNGEVLPLDPKAQCDARDFQKKFFAIAAGGKYSTDAGRAELVGSFTEDFPEPTQSLSAFLKGATNAMAQALCDELESRMADDEYEPRLALYRELAAQARELGVMRADGKAWSLPKEAEVSKVRAILPLAKLNNWISQLESGIAAKKAEAAASTIVPAAPDAEEEDDGSDPFSEEGEESPSGVLFDEPEVGTPKKAGTAPASSTPPTDGAPVAASEASGDSKAPETESVSEAEIVDPELEKQRADLMEAALKAGYQHDGDMAFPALVEQLNLNKKLTKAKKDIASIEDYDLMTCAIATSLLEQGKLDNG